MFLLKFFFTFGKNGKSKHSFASVVQSVAIVKDKLAKNAKLQTFQIFLNFIKKISLN